jgi:mevalonate kinase
MPAFSASAPGKIILFGEHAVVYGFSAIAVPVTQVRAKATVTPNIYGETGVVIIDAPDVGLESELSRLPEDNPIGAAIHGLLDHLKTDHIPACTLNIKSTIPVASGLGSGAAVSVAILRALAGFLGLQLPDETVSSLAFEVEKIHHGTPSGIDNTVVTYAKPVYFTKDHPIETFKIRKPFTIVIGDTGIASPTKETVGDVRSAWKKNPTHYNCLFAAIGSLTKTARLAIQGGHPERLGPLMDENHQLLGEMGVSSPALDRLAEAAKAAGALGAKLSGGGRGGNMIALVNPPKAEAISNAIRGAGGHNTIITTVQNRRDSSTD